MQTSSSCTLVRELLCFPDLRLYSYGIYGSLSRSISTLQSDDAGVEKLYEMHMGNSPGMNTQQAYKFWEP